MLKKIFIPLLILVGTIAAISCSNSSSSSQPTAATSAMVAPVTNASGFPSPSLTPSGSPAHETPTIEDDSDLLTDEDLQDLALTSSPSETASAVADAAPSCTTCAPLKIRFNSVVLLNAGTGNQALNAHITLRGKLPNGCSSTTVGLRVLDANNNVIVPIPSTVTVSTLPLGLEIALTANIPTQLKVQVYDTTTGTTCATSNIRRVNANTRVATATPTPTNSATLTATATPTLTPSGTLTTTATNTVTLSPTNTPTPVPTYKIVFEGAFPGPDGIVVMNADGSDPVQLTAHGGVDIDPRFNMGQTKIVWNSEFVGGWAIWTMNADGSNQTQLTNPGIYQDRRPCWSPDGTKICFSSSRSGIGWFELYTMNPDGSNVTQLTSDPNTNDQPSWSPDGTKIAFAKGDDIWVMNPDGSGQAQLTATNNNESPCWSIDGTHIAFDSQRTGKNQIYVMNPDGSNVTNLSNNGYGDLMPIYTPDSRSILFYTYGRSGVPNGTPQIYRMNLDGSNQVDLVGTSYGAF